MNTEFTFTLQDILSIKKDTWLDFIKKHLTDNQVKHMEDSFLSWQQEKEENEIESRYKIHNKRGDLIIVFYNDHIMPDMPTYKQYCYELYEQYFLKKFKNSSLEGLMRLIIKLIQILFDLDTTNPPQATEKVLTVLSELIKNKKQRICKMKDRIKTEVKITLEQTEFSDTVPLLNDLLTLKNIKNGEVVEMVSGNTFTILDIGYKAKHFRGESHDR